jgi:hypothetical protein
MERIATRFRCTIQRFKAFDRYLRAHLAGVSLKNRREQIMKRFLQIGALSLVSVLAPLASHAEAPGAHPAYLHAISDLRAARWLIEHRPGNWQRTEDESAAVRQIDEAIHDMKEASIDDGKNTNDHPPVDERADQPGRLHEAIDYLRKARADVSREEDNAYANGLRARSIGHIDGAIRSVKHAVHDE